VKGAVTSEDREEMNRLCRLIQDEPDPAKFSALVEQLNNLLESQEERLESETPKSRLKSN
jgi:hypothetical protein